MLSGGADSTCLLDVAVKLGARVSALHVNYALRGAESDADEAHCHALCEALGVELHVERPVLAEGNLQAAARDARYAAAERIAAGDYAAAHTRSDQAETVPYRHPRRPPPLRPGRDGALPARDLAGGARADGDGPPPRSPRAAAARGLQRGH